MPTCPTRLGHRQHYQASYGAGGGYVYDVICIIEVINARLVALEGERQGK